MVVIMLWVVLEREEVYSPFFPPSLEKHSHKAGRMRQMGWRGVLPLLQLGRELLFFTALKLFLLFCFISLKHSGLLAGQLTRHEKKDFSQRMEMAGTGWLQGCGARDACGPKLPCCASTGVAVEAVRASSYARASLNFTVWTAKYLWGETWGAGGAAGAAAVPGHAQVCIHPRVSGAHSRQLSVHLG